MIEIEKTKDIELELSDYCSLIYNIDEKQYYIWEFNLTDEEEYLTIIDIENKNNIQLYDYTVTKEDKEFFQNLIKEVLCKD